MSARQAGFTLVELVVAMVIMSLVTLAVFRVLEGQSDAVRVQSTTIDIQQTNRMVAGVLAAELREVSPSEGDLIAAEPDSVTVRLVRKMAIVCNPDAPGQKVDTWVLSDGFAGGDSLTIFADGDPLSGNDDNWIYADVASVDSVNTSDPNCGDLNTRGRARLNLGGIGGGNLANVIRGAPLRSFTRMTYGVYQKDGEWVLGRHTPGDTVVALAGPLHVDANSRGVEFRYLDANGAAVTPSTDALRATVRRIQILVHSGGTVRGDSFSDSLVTQVYLRNNQ